MPTGGTSGGSGVSGAGGSSGANSTGGAAGMAGSIGSGGTVGTGGTGPALDPCRVLKPGDTGWIDASSNCVAFQGASWTFGDDESGASITASYSDEKICLAGTTAGWGVFFQQQFNASAAYDAVANAVSGLRFALTGACVPDEMRILIHTLESEYCKMIYGPGVHDVLFSDTHPDCSTSAGAATPELSELTLFSVHITAPNGVAPFDFCIDPLAALESGG